MELSNYILWIQKIDTFLYARQEYPFELDMNHVKRTKPVTPPRFQLGRAPVQTKKQRNKRRRQTQQIPASKLSSGWKGAPPTFQCPYKPTALFANISVAPISYHLAAAQAGASLTEKQTYVNSIILGWKRLSSQGIAFEQSLPFKVPKPFHDYVQTLRIWLKAEIRVRYNLRRFVQQWLLKRYGSRMLNTDDPCTLCSPVYPVCLFDAKSRGIYAFEAISIQKTMERSLGFTSWLFPEPKAPKNPFTNMPFHLGQLLKCLTVLRTHGKSSWILEAYRSSNYTLRRLQDEFRIPLKLHGLTDCMENPTNQDTYEMVQDFVEDQATVHAIDDRVAVTAIYWGVEHKPHEPYIQKWRTLWHEWMRTTILHGTNYYSENIVPRKSLHTRSKLLLEAAEPVDTLIVERKKWMDARNPPLPFPAVTLNFSPMSTQGVFNLQELLQVLNAEFEANEL